MALALKLEVSNDDEIVTNDERTKRQTDRQKKILWTFLAFCFCSVLPFLSFFLLLFLYAPFLYPVDLQPSTFTLFVLFCPYSSSNRTSLGLLMCIYSTIHLSQSPTNQTQQLMHFTFFLFSHITISIPLFLTKNTTQATWCFPRFLAVLHLSKSTRHFSYHILIAYT